MRPTLPSRLRSVFARITHVDSAAIQQAATENMHRRLEATPYWAWMTADARIERLKNEVVQLVEKYRGKTTERFVLVDRAYGLDFLADLEALGIAVMSCDHYEYLPYRGPVNLPPDGSGLTEVDGKKYVAYPGIRITPASHPEGLVEILDGGSYVGDEIYYSSEPTAASIRVTREHILTKLPLEAAFIEIGLMIPSGWLGHTSPYS